MERDRWQRWSPLAGVAFAVLFLAALGVGGTGPGETPDEVADWYADEGNRSAAFLVFFLLAGAALAFLWFLGVLRSVLVRAEGDPARWTAVGFAAGVASATLLLASASLYVAPAATAGDDDFPFDPSAAETFTNAGFALLVSSTMAGALLVLATSIVAHRTGLLPGWLALGGFVVAAVLLFAIFFLPLFVWLAWVLAVSVVLVVRSARVAGWRSGVSS
ncbi:MAG TPA: hypothetical protein VD769_09195 [Gaiellaceae bacterium]|nr:hypothetical protein [Gaiellaceae bacterium]